MRCTVGSEVHIGLLDNEAYCVKKEKRQMNVIGSIRIGWCPCQRKGNRQSCYQVGVALAPWYSYKIWLCGTQNQKRLQEKGLFALGYSSCAAMLSLQASFLQSRPGEGTWSCREGAQALLSMLMACRARVSRLRVTEAAAQVLLLVVLYESKIWLHIG